MRKKGGKSSKFRNNSNDLENTLNRLSKQKSFLLHLLVLLCVFLFLVLITQSGDIGGREIGYSMNTFNINSTFSQDGDLEISLPLLAHSLDISGKIEGDTQIYALIGGSKYLVLDSNNLENNSFINVCEETCNLTLDEKNITLQIFVQGNIYLDSLNYLASNSENTPPYWNGRNIFIVDNVKEFKINLEEYVNDLEYDRILFEVPQESQKYFSLENNELKLIPSKDLRGTIELVLKFNDGIDTNFNKINFFVIGDIELNETPEIFIDPSLVNELYKKNRAKVIIEVDDSEGRKNIKEIVDNSNNLSSKTKTSIGASISSFVKAHHEDLHISVKQSYDSNNMISAEISSEGLEELKKNKNIKAIYMDPILTLDLSESIGLINGISKSNINNTEIILTGKDNSVCIIDTGVDNHKAFGDRIIDQQCFCEVSNLGNGGCCPNVEIRDDSAQDDSFISHGTKIAGIVGADGDVRGVAPESNIIAVKTCDFLGRCLGSDILAGIDYCISKKEEFNVVSISGSFSDGEKYSNVEECPSLFDTSLNNSLNNNIIPVFSSGNEYYRGGIGFPSCSPYSISVGAFGEELSLEEYSNVGNLLDILAPGESIESTSRNNRYSSSSGTSMATPHVSGAIALIRQDEMFRRNEIYNTEDIITALKRAGVLVGGYPILDVKNTLNLLHGENLSGYVRPRNMYESNSEAVGFGGLTKIITDHEGSEIETYSLNGKSFSLIKNSNNNKSSNIDKNVHIDVSDINLGGDILNLYNTYENGILSQEVQLISDEILVELEGEPIIEYQLKENSEQKIQSYINTLSSQRLGIKEQLNILGVETNAELDSVFNGIIVKATPEQIEYIKTLEGVKQIHYSTLVTANLRESLDIINTSYAWNLEKERVNITGKGIKIAIVDTGVDYTHPDVGGCFGTGCKVSKGYDFVNNDNNPMDDHGHGTHVAATAGGDGDLNNGGLRGVAPDVEIYAYKVLNSGGSGSSTNIIKAIETAVDDGADIISMSLGGGGTSDSPMGVASNNAMNAGVVVVVAAGNSGPSAETIGSPGNAHDIITVGATDKSDKIASFSSRGPTSTLMVKPEIIAPGVNICAAQWDSWLSSRGCSPSLENHIAISGTSMATPHVAGAVALIKQLNPQLTTQEIKSILISSADDLGYGVNTQGGGRLNLKKALESDLLFSPSVLNFGNANTNTNTLKLNITNFGGDPLNVTLTSSSFSDGKTEIQGILSFSESGFSLNEGESKIIDVNLRLDNLFGEFGGIVKVYTNNSKSYNIPIYFSRVYELKLKYKKNSRDLFSPSIVVVHDKDISFYEAVYPTQSSSTFRIKQNGTIYYNIIGNSDIWEENSHSIISGSVDVQKDTEKIIVRNDYPIFDIPARDFDGNEIDISQFYYLTTIKGKERNLVITKGLSAFHMHGDQKIYLSEDDNINKEIEVYFMGIPETYHKSLWKGKDTDHLWNINRYANSPEIYFVGNKIRAGEEINFSYDKSEFGEYKYNYNLHTNMSEYFDDVTFWVSPSSTFALTPFLTLGAPITKTRYIQDNGYGHWAMTKISHTNTNDSILNIYFGNARTEDYQPTSLWPRGIRAKSGEKLELYLGSPYSFPDFSNSLNNIRLRDRTLMGGNKNSYITRSPSFIYNSKTYNLEKPRVVVRNADTNTIVSNREIFYWNGYNQYANAKNLRATIDIDPSYPVLNTTIDAWFSNGQNPPYLSYIGGDTWFGDNYNVEFNISSPKLLRRVNLEYKDSEGDWKSASKEEPNKGEYRYSINTLRLDKLDVRINAEIDENNKIMYEFHPIANKQINVDFGLKSNIAKPSSGQTVTLSGKCIDENGNNCNGLIFKIYYNNELLFNEMSDLFKADWSRSFIYNNGGVVKLLFDGTGHYAPVIETLKLGEIIDLTPPNISQITQTPSIVYNDRNVLFSASVTDNIGVDKVLVRHNASGSWRNYDTVLSEGEYIYTIDSSLLSNQEIIGWQFIANDSSGNHANSEIYIFKVENRKPISQKVSSINIIEEQIAQIRVNVSDPDGDRVRIIYPDPFENSGAWISTRGDAGNYSFSVVATDSIDSILIPVNVYVEALPPIREEKNESLNESIEIPEYKRIIGDFNEDKYDTFTRLRYLIGDSINLSEIFEGKKRIKFDDNGKDVLEFFHEFKEGKELNISKIELIKQRNSENRGSLIVKGVPRFDNSNETKTIYLDNINSNLHTICIKDAEIEDINEISSKCNGVNEYILDCSSSSLQYENYTCTNLGERYKITGLRNSGAFELCVDDDNDGSCLPMDCNDNNNGVYPNATEICGDGIDQDCNGSDLSCPASPPSTPGSGGSGGGGGGSKQTLSDTETPILDEEENIESIRSSDDEQKIQTYDGYDGRLLQKTQELCDQINLYSEDTDSIRLKQECKIEINALNRKTSNIDLNNNHFLIVLVLIIVISLGVYHFRFNLNLAKKRRKKHK